MQGRHAADLRRGELLYAASGRRRKCGDRRNPTFENDDEKSGVCERPSRGCSRERGRIRGHGLEPLGILTFTIVGSMFEG